MSTFSFRRWGAWASLRPRPRRPAPLRRSSRPHLEKLEGRVTPASLPPVAADDAAWTWRDTTIGVAVLANDYDPDGTLDPSSLALTAAPLHGSAGAYRPGVNWDNDSSPVGDGWASAFAWAVDEFGHISLAVSAGGWYQPFGDYALFVRVGVTDFADFDPAVFDFRWDATLVPDESNFFDVPGLVPGTPYIAWVDNTVSDVHPDTLLQALGTPVIAYSPDWGFTGTDSFSYTVKDGDGLVSHPATVTIAVLNRPPVAWSDEAWTREGVATAIDVLANDYDPDGAVDPSSLAVAAGPAHGSATVGQGEFGPVVVYTPEPGFRGTDAFTYTVSDNEGLASNEATVTVTVLNQPPVANPDSATTVEGEPVAIDVLANDFDPDLALPPDAPVSVISGPARGTVTVGQSPLGQTILVYAPGRSTGLALVVDDPTDVDDGDHSPGHLTLREAVRLANADGYTDTFTYAVQDLDGLWSGPAAVTVEVRPGPTTITFAPALTARGPAELRLFGVGDTSEGNSALPIISPITIAGPSGRFGIILSGPGTQDDLRAFVVQAGGALAMENLTLRNWSSDGSGGALFVAAGGAATLTDCTLTGNSAFADGGAV